MSAQARVSQRKHRDIGDYVRMRVVRFAGLALSVCMLVLNTPVAFADASMTPKPTPQSSFDAAMLQYKLEMDKYRIQIQEREKIRKEITQRFMTAVTQANKTAKSALGLATTPETKATIISVQRNAIALAVLARDAALLSMEPAPVQPIKPIKPIRPGVSKAKTQATPGKPSPSP